ncbi:MAG TPA: trypsin-like peptidase domain-containing protein [Candidatus Paceibacterota bacterium]|nr:trypsin-like peptidase domain-containing protein [Candidatus Paceibacterota bacterium]
MRSEYSLTIRAAEKSIPSVVGILVTKHISLIEKELGEDALQYNSPVFNYLGKQEKIDENGMVKLAGCSGFFIDQKGTVLTNRHVVADSSSEYTVIWNNHEYPATILAVDEINDLAFLKIDAKKTPYLWLGDSSKIRLGQTVVAIGNALGEFQNTVSRGIVSGLSRYITADTINTLGKNETQKIKGLIQTDAAINPGNSGGPLIDLKGNVIGINAVAIIGVENIGFAIPSNKAIRAWHDFQKYGKLIKRSLGFKYILLNNELQKKHNFKTNEGAYIPFECDSQENNLDEDGLAEKAGIVRGDIILAINNQKINLDNLPESVMEHLDIGDRLIFTVLRQGQISKITTTFSLS